MLTQSASSRSTKALTALSSGSPALAPRRSHRALTKRYRPLAAETQTVPARSAVIAVTAPMDSMPSAPTKVVTERLSMRASPPPPPKPTQTVPEGITWIARMGRRGSG